MGAPSIRCRRTLRSRRSVFTHSHRTEIFPVVVSSRISISRVTIWPCIIVSVVVSDRRSRTVSLVSVIVSVAIPIVLLWPPISHATAPRKCRHCKMLKTLIPTQFTFQGSVPKGRRRNQGLNRTLSSPAVPKRHSLSPKKLDLNSATVREKLQIIANRLNFTEFAHKLKEYVSN